MGRAFAKIAHWLVDHGHHVVVVVPAPKDQVIEARAGLRVQLTATRSHLHWRLRSWIYRGPKWLRDFCWQRETNASLADAVAEAQRNQSVEVVLGSASCADVLVRRHTIPTVIRMQNPWRDHERAEFRSMTLNSFWGQFAERFVTRRATRVYSPSRIAANRFQRERSKPIPVIRTPMFPLTPSAEWPVVAARFKLPERFLLFCSGLLGSKGAHVLAEALPRFFSEAPDTHAVIVGRVSRGPRGGTMDAYFRACCAACPDRLHILDAVDHDALFAMMQRCHFAVLPSLVDNLPNALLETMYFGCVIVAARGASLDELLDDQDAVFAKPGDADDLAKAMLRADLLDPPTRALMSKRVAAKVRRECDPEAVMPQVVALCEEARASWSGPTPSLATQS